MKRKINLWNGAAINPLQASQQWEFSSSERLRLLCVFNRGCEWAINPLQFSHSWEFWGKNAHSCVDPLQTSQQFWGKTADCCVCSFSSCIGKTGPGSSTSLRFLLLQPCLRASLRSWGVSEFRWSSWLSLVVLFAFPVVVVCFVAGKENGKMLRESIKYSAVCF